MKACGSPLVAILLVSSALVAMTRGDGPGLAEEVPVPEIAWTRLLGTSANEEAAGVASGPDGSVYVAGTTGTRRLGTQVSHGRLDVVAARYGADGELLWQRLFGGPGGEFASDAASAPDGSLFVSGFSRSRSFDGPGETHDFRGFVVHVSPEGELLGHWFVAPEDSVSAEAVAIDARGNVFIAGTAYGPVGNRPDPSLNAVIASYAPNGRLRWLRLFDDSANRDGGSTEEAFSVAVGTDGNVYAAGVIRAPVFNDILVVSYSNRGAFRWARAIGGQHEDRALGIAAGPGGVFVTGDTRSPTFDGHRKKANTDLVALKYSNGGRLQWSRLLGGPGAEAGEDVAIGGDGKVYVAGYSNSRHLLGQGTRGARDMILASYEPSGQWRWFIPVGGARRESATAVAAGPRGTLHIAGYTRGPDLNEQPAAGLSDMAIVRFEARP
jgi:hypothetical protein